MAAINGEFYKYSVPIHNGGKIHVKSMIFNANKSKEMIFWVRKECQTCLLNTESTPPSCAMGYKH